MAGGAGAAGHDDGQVTGHDLGGVAGDLAGGRPIAGVEGRLAAAGLVLGEKDFDAKVLEDFDGGAGGVIVKRVAQAGGHEEDLAADGAWGGNHG